jgi:hypothetical protein
MLAYVFWHWKDGSIEGPRYESLMREFHESLARRPPPGFERSAAFGVERMPWMEAGGYEEWYLVADTAALDPLNEGAVRPPHAEAHDAVARRAAGGAAGLYRLRRGNPDWPRLGSAQWFGKPRGMRYPDLDALLDPFVRDGAALWMRQMVLGPVEFCLQSPSSVGLPATLSPLVSALRRLRS